MSIYKIKIIRSVCGNFTWQLFLSAHNNSFRKIAEAPQMFTSRQSAEKISSRVSKSLRCPVEFLDMEKDWEE